MKFIISNLLLIIAFIFVMPFHSKAFTNSASNNEVKDEQNWLSSHSEPEPEPSYLPGDPGIPEAPLDNNMYFLIAASLVYGFVLFRKEKRLKL
jgi:hypothetical protein